MRTNSSISKKIYSSEELGGKARNLQILDELALQEGMSFKVPSWYVITHKELASLLPAEIVDEIDYETIRHAIEQVSIPHVFVAEISQQMGQDRSTQFAVRSSALDEDGKDFSFAGQFESYLFVPFEDLTEHIKKVWLSAFSERVKAYRAEHELPAQSRISIIIQEMVDAEVSGVGFGLNPVSGARNERVISAVYGLGEGIVSGQLNADDYIFNKDDQTIKRKIVAKEWAIEKSEELSGVEKVAVPEERSKKACLEDSQVVELAKLLNELKKHYGKAQDIEFAYLDKQLYLLQSRAVTNLGRFPDPHGARIVWDNSNIIESYPGVTTPLTFSFIIKMYEAVYTQFALLLGIKEKELEPHKQTLANMLGILNGRVYYNLKNWFKLLAMLPAYSLNAGFMEKMMGVKEKFELEEGEYSQLSKTQARIRLLSTGRKMLGSLRRLPKEKKKFKAFLDKVIAEYEEINFEEKRPDELMQLYMRFERVLVKEWKAPLINDLFAMIYFGSLEKLIKKWKVGNNPNLHNDLHCGSQDIISTEPITRLFALTKAIQQDPDAKLLFESEDADEIWRRLNRTGAKYKEVKRQVTEYIQKFGERCVGELKLETISYKQQPAVLIDILKSYVKQGVTERLSEENLEEKLRMAAESEVKTSLKGKWLKKRIFNYVLRMSRDLVSSRENLRYERTRGFGVVRSIFSALGKQFYSEGVLENERDIFYLSKEEIFSFISGTSISTRLRETVALRQAEYAGYKEMKQPSDRIHSKGMVYHGNSFYQKKHKQIVDGDLKGIGCCPGRVKAKVRVIMDPREINTLDGDILVTSSTDPGWVTLFPTASAILVERGSLLSHSAIVSREMGIPCIVGIDGLLDSLNSGDLVEMDGSSGEIKIL